MHIIKSVGVLSVAKIMGMIYGCMGLIFVPFFLLIGLMGSALGQQNSPLAGIFGVGFAVLMPVIYGLIGFIAGLIGALLYNLFARWVGGFELELEVRPAFTAAPYPVVPPANPGN
ncbi:MAG TPA: hypothetical protein VNX26_07605 [Candidatus Acidoferrum sp.]|jgi:hypothetical protein|nr:hypothetical protein [Candidatus Acidoferrum sp.]